MSYKSLVQERQKALSDLISKEAVGDQKTLVALLAESYGIQTNQTVISRDLRSLGVVKRQIKDQLIYALPKIDVTTEILKLAIVDIRYNETTIVVKTHPGLADFVGDCIDERLDTETLGCMAGENVVFVVPESTKKIKKTFETVCAKLHFQL